MQIMIHDLPIPVKATRWQLAVVLGVLLIAIAPGATFGQPPGGESEYGESEMEEDYDMEDYDMDMDSEDEYGSSEYGGSRSRRGSASDAMMQSYGSTMSSLLRNVDLDALLAPASEIPPVDAGPVLSSEAEHAYQNGHYPLAMELHFAHMATEYGQAGVKLQKVNFSKLLRRPVWHTRFGVSFAVRGDLDADPQPIEEGKTPVNRMAGGGDEAEYGGDGDDYGQDQPYEPEETMEMDDEMDDEMSEMDSSGYGSNRRSSRATKPQVVMLDQEANAELDKYLGLVAKITAEQFEARYRQGDFGPALISVMPPGEVTPRSRDDEEPVVASFAKPMSQEITETLADSPAPRPMWRPGIVYFGEGDSKDVVKQANRENVDVLLHFDILLDANRQGYVQNTSFCRLVHVASGKRLVSSKGIDNFEAIRFAKSGRSSDREYVTAQLENLFAIMDRDVKSIEMPKFAADVAKKRIGSLLSGSSARSLRTLAEIRLYQVQQLITEEEAEAAFEIVGGEDALLLLHGPQEQRLRMARQWAARAVPKFNE